MKKIGEIYAKVMKKEKEPMAKDMKKSMTAKKASAMSRAKRYF